jgi:hypothetical protein
MIGEYIHLILLVTGAITCSMIVGVFAPGMVLKYCFLENRPSAGQMLMIQHWFLVVALTGSLIVYAAYQPAVRSAAVTVAAVEKFSIGALVAASPARNWRLASIATIDGIMGLLYIGYLLDL